MLTEVGHRLLHEDIGGRKKLLAEQMMKLGTFRFIVDILGEAKDHQLPEDIVLEEWAIRLPTSDAETQLKTVVAWGRFAELFNYDADTQMLSLPASKQQVAS